MAGEDVARVYCKGDRKIHVYRLAKTAILFLSWICLGLYNEVVGPTLPDLKDRSGSNYEQISRILSARSAGLFVGSVLGGAVHDRWAKRRDLVLAVALLVSAVTIAVAPWCTSLWLLGIVFHLMGQSHGLLTTGANPTLAILWADQAAGPFNFMHAGFGLGGTIGPLMSQPFMSARQRASAVANESASNMTTPATESNATLYSAGSQIEVPYGIVGILCTLMALAFLGFYVTRLPGPFTPREIPWRAILNPRTCAGGQTAFGCKMLVLLFLYYMFVVGGERAYGKFIFSYAIDSRLGLTKAQATWLTAAYWLCYTAARLLVFALTKFLSIHVLLFIEVSGTLVSAIFLNIFPETPAAFWLFSMSFGLFKSPLFPSCLGWANRYIEVNSMAIMCVNIGSSTGGMVVQWLTGFLFEYYGPSSFLYLIVAYSAAIFILFFVMHRVASLHGDKYSAKETADRSPTRVNKIGPMSVNGEMKSS